MKATIKKAALLECMKSISAAFISESHPIHFHAENGKLTFQTVILDKAIYDCDSNKKKNYHILGRVYNEVPASVEENGDFFSCGKFLSRIVEKSHADDIVFETSICKSVETLKVKIGKTEYKLHKIPPFPLQAPDTKSSAEYRVDATEFKKIVNNASKLCPKTEEENVPYSKFLHFIIEGKNLTVQSARKIKATSLKCAVINPLGMGTEFAEYPTCFKSLLAEIEKGSYIEFGNNPSHNWWFTAGSLIVEMIHVECQFPMLENIFPKTFETATVETKKFIQTFKKVSILAENIHKAVSVHFNKTYGLVELMTYSDKDGSIATINFPAEIHEDADVVIDKDFLQHLATFTSEKIQIHVDKGKIGIFDGDNIFIHSKLVKLSTEILTEMQKDAAKNWIAKQEKFKRTTHKSAA